MWSSNYTSDYIIFKTLERIWIYNPNTEIFIYPCFYQKMEGVQMLINRWMSRQKVVYMYNGILFNLRKVLKKIYNMDKIWGLYSKDKAVVLVWLDWLVFCEYGFSVSALWCLLAIPTILLGFLLPWAWGISSRLLQQSAANAPYLGQGVARGAT